MARFLLLIGGFLVALGLLGPTEQAVADVRIDLKAAQEFYQSGDYDQALVHISRAIESGQLPPRTMVQALVGRGAIYIRNGRLDDAIADFDRVLEIAPEHAEAYNNRCFAYLSLQEFQSAIDDCSRAIELSPDHAQAYGNRAEARHGNGDIDQALSDIDQAPELVSNQPLLHYRRGNILLALGRQEEAIASFTAAIELNPSYVEAYVNRGAVFNEAGNSRLAIEDYDRALELIPDNALILNNRCDAYIRLGEFENALRDCDAAIAQARRHESEQMLAVIHFTRGKLFEAMRNQEQAEADYRAAFDLFPNSPIIEAKARELQLVN